MKLLNKIKKPILPQMLLSNYLVQKQQQTVFLMNKKRSTPEKQP
jgi:hypothetical protein